MAAYRKHRPLDYLRIASKFVKDLFSNHVIHAKVAVIAAQANRWNLTQLRNL